MLRLGKWWSHYRAFILYLLIGLLARFWNYRNFLFFTWDQGRDAFVLAKIVGGDLVLTGPTSGLPGFFLGPLWYYVGIPGYVLSNGSPYGISLWYIGLASLALPLFWYLSHRLFSSRRLAMVTAYLLSLVPGSISGSTMVWNPMLTLPLMTLAFLSFWQARRRSIWLWLGFFWLALALQAEFAYAIFFVPVLFLLIPWLRQRWQIRDWLGSAVAVGITLLPQLAFELRHQWIMTRALTQGLLNPANNTSWSHLWLYRPSELLQTTLTLFWGGLNQQAILLTPIILIAFLLALITINRWRHLSSERVFGWRLLTLFAFIPYPFFLIWRGNYGNFFSYYLTPHFIFLVPLVVLGLSTLSTSHFPKSWRRLVSPREVVLFCFGIIFAVGVLHLSVHLREKDNRAGLLRMEQAVSLVFHWSDLDQINQPLVRIFTPNLQTEQYDFLFRWQARRLGQPIPLTVRTGQEAKWYVFTEPDYQIPEKRFVPWYRNATAGGYLWRHEQIGVLTLETWGTSPPPVATPSGAQP